MKYALIINLLFLNFTGFNSLLASEVKIEAALSDKSIYNLSSEWLDQNDQVRQLKDFRGKKIVLSMVYLKCKFSCPFTIAQMKDIELKLDKKLKSKVQFVLVSFDIKNDVAKSMKEYANKNHLDDKNWIFLRAKTDSDVRELSGLIDFKYKKLPDGEYEHSYAIIAIDSEGVIIGRTEGAQLKPKVIIDLLEKSN